jgi:hypothetical protein
VEIENQAARSGPKEGSFIRDNRGKAESTSFTCGVIRLAVYVGTVPDWNIPSFLPSVMFNQERILSTLLISLSLVSMFFTYTLLDHVRTVTTQVPLPQGKAYRKPREAHSYCTPSYLRIKQLKHLE